MAVNIEASNELILLSTFLESIKDDPRITRSHISLYASLISHWYTNNMENPVCIFSHEIMPACKMSGIATYHRTIRELHEYGYIKYQPSFNHFLGSLVYLL